MPRLLSYSHCAHFGLAFCCALIAGCPAAPVSESPTVFTSLKQVGADLTPTVAIEDQWSGWRGGQCHGVSSAPHLPTQWQVDAGIRWKSPLAGEGNSSPVVWGERVFVTSVVDKQAMVVCLHRSSGDVAWQRAVGSPSGQTHTKNGFASSTATTNGQLVFAAFSGLGLFALDFDGQVVWQHSLAEVAHEWGQAASPVLFENLLIHVADGEQHAHLIALEAATGSEVWRASRASRGSWCSPVVVNAGSDESPQWEVVINGSGSGKAGEVHAYDARTGRERWHVRGTTDIPCPTMLVGEGLLVSATGSNGPIFAIKTGGEGDLTNSHVAWRLPSGGPYVPTGLIYQERVYLVSDSGLVTCQRLSDGHQLWRKRLHGAFSASLVAGAGHVYATSERGDVYVFKAADQFELVATNRLHEACLATPAIAQGEMYVRTDKHLCCIHGASTLVRETSPAAPPVESATIRSPNDVEASALSAEPLTN